MQYYIKQLLLKLNAQKDAVRHSKSLKALIIKYGTENENLSTDIF